MKKLLLIISIIALLTACGTYSSVDSMSQLRSGMNKMEVEYYLGTPIDVLTVNYTQNGVQEVLAYRNNYDEVYAVEFWNDYLTGYEYLYDDRPYIAPAYPRMMPPAGRPIIVAPGRDRPNRPNRPSKPIYPARPNGPDDRYSRPPSNGRPTNNSRPSDNTNNSRPGNNNSGTSNNGRSSNGRYGNRTTTTNNDDKSTNTPRNTNSSRSSSSSSRSTETMRTTNNSSSTSNIDRSSSTRTSKRTDSK